MYQPGQIIQVVIFLSALTLPGAEQNTCIIPAVKVLSPSRGTVHEVMEPPQNSESSCLCSQQAAKRHRAEGSGLLSRGGRASWDMGVSSLCPPVSQLPLPGSPITGKGQGRQTSLLEGSCISSCESWRVWRQPESEM